MIQAAYGPITAVHDTQKHALGTKYSPDGINTYLYLQGVANTAQYSVVTFDLSTGATALAVADAVGTIAIAQAAIVANKFGWYLVDGTGTFNAGDVADNAVPYLTSTAGRLDDAAVSGDRVYNAVIRSEETSNLATIEIHYAYVANIATE